MNVQRAPDGRTVAYLTASEWRHLSDDVKTQERGVKWVLVPFGDGKLIAEVVLVNDTSQERSPPCQRARPAIV